MEKRIPVKLNLSYWSFTCYIRLFFSELLPDLERVLHIDCDTIIKGTLEEIYQSEFQNNLCGACYDCLPTPKIMAGLSKQTSYFSNGILLFNLKQMRKEHTQEKFINYIVEQKGELPHLDQDVVNFILHGRIFLLPAKYNLMTQTILFGEKSCNFFRKNEPYYTPAELYEAIKSPSVVHLVGYKFVSRPWEQPCYHPYNKEWMEYYKKIEFKDNEILLKRKSKKYGLVREIVCLIWNIGYRISFFRSIEFSIEKNRLEQIRKKYSYANIK